MTISNETTKKDAVGGVTDYSFPFRIIADSDLQVYTEDSDKILTLKTLNVDYTVTFVQDVEGGTVVFGVAVSGSLNVLIVRETPDTQGTDFEKNKAIDAEANELSLDKITMLTQQALEVSGRSLRIGFNYDLDEIVVSDDADKYAIIWDADTSQFILSAVANVTVPGKIVYNESTNIMDLLTNDIIALRLDADQMASFSNDVTVAGDIWASGGSVNVFDPYPLKFWQGGLDRSRQYYDNSIRASHIIDSGASVDIFLDSNDSSTDAKFKIQKDSDTQDAGVSLFEVEESGNASLPNGRMGIGPRCNINSGEISCPNNTATSFYTFLSSQEAGYVMATIEGDSRCSVWSYCYDASGVHFSSTEQETAGIGTTTLALARSDTDLQFTQVNAGAATRQVNWSIVKTL